MRQIITALAEQTRQTGGLLRLAINETAPIHPACSSSGGLHSCLRGLTTSTACARAANEPNSSARDVKEPELPPWTPSSARLKRGFLPRRMGHLMQVLEQERASTAQEQRQFPEFDAGDVLEVKTVTPQNQGREAVFKGLCIARYDRGWRTSFRLRNHIANAGAIERTYPLYSPIIQSIRVLERRPVRRAKLYYLRDRLAKEYRT